MRSILELLLITGAGSYLIGLATGIYIYSMIRRWNNGEEKSDTDGSTQ